jgi:hypothetical protein
VQAAPDGVDHEDVLLVPYALTVISQPGPAELKTASMSQYRIGKCGRMRWHWRWQWGRIQVQAAVDGVDHEDVLLAPCALTVISQLPPFSRLRPIVFGESSTNANRSGMGIRRRSVSVRR